MTDRTMCRAALALVLIGTMLLVARPTAATPRVADPGSRLWLARFGHRGSATARAVATSPDGKMVFVVGSSWDGRNSGLVTVAYSASTGKELWRDGYGGRSRPGVTAMSLVVSPTEDLIFVTASASTSHRSAGATIAYEASTGARVWIQRYAADPKGLAVSPDGATVFVIGVAFDVAGFAGFVTVAYDATTGAEVWAMTRDRGGTAVAVSPDGAQLFVSGTTGRTSTDYLTLAYDAGTGSREWLTRFRSPGSSEYIAAIDVSPDGARVFVTGNDLQDLPWHEHSTTVAYDASTGEAVWDTRSTAGALRTPDNPASLTVSPDSEVVYVAGRSIGGGDWWDIVTTAYDASSGDKLWGRRFSGRIGFGTVENDIVLSPDGSTLYVTGGTGSPYRPDYVTLAYDAAMGRQMWIRTYEGPHRYDTARSIAVSPDGTRVFVTGESDGSTGRDLVTIAYAT